MIVYYISSHGFGHAVRSCEIIRNLAPEIPLTLRTCVPEWFLRHELDGRKFELAPERFDCGVLGPDSSAIDLEATLATLEPLLDRNDTIIEEEARLLKERGARLVVADIVPFAMRAAHQAGVPSILVANFTWPAIYEYIVRHYCDDAVLRARLMAAAARMHADDALGELLLAPDLAVPMQACRRQRQVALVARRGASRRDQLTGRLNLNPIKPLVLLYFGREGIAEMAWERMDELREDFEFISYQPPTEARGSIHSIPEDLLHHVDAAASVDVVLAKPGYGICGECIAAGTPLIYPPRPQFYETVAIDRVMERWGGGSKINEDDFKQLNWKGSIEAALERQPNPEAIRTDGGAQCGAILARAWETGRIE